MTEKYYMLFIISYYIKIKSNINIWFNLFLIFQVYYKPAPAPKAPKVYYKPVPNYKPKVYYKNVA